jgi:hypothetical protein
VREIGSEIGEFVRPLSDKMKLHFFAKALMNMKNGVFWVVTPCGSCKNRRFGGTWRLLHQNFVTLMKEAPGLSETSFLTRATRCNNPEDTILHSHRRENLKSYFRLKLCVSMGGL